jgi:diguanylate cyclase (GGDEF)-like protein
VIHRAAQLQRTAAIRRRLGLAAMFVMAAMFAAIIVNALLATSERRKVEVLHLHSLDVLLISGGVETALNTALRGERGYLLTHDPKFLEPFVEGRERALTLSAQLHALTVDNPVQRHNLRSFQPRLTAYLKTLSRLIALERQGRHLEAVEAIKRGVGRQQITELIASLHRVEAEERRLLVQRRVASEAANDRIETYNYLVGGAGLLLMLFLTCAILSATRAHRKSVELAEELHNLASTDALTGLPNRRQLLASLDVEMRRAERSGRPLALALLDVDRFKSVNDTHGHAAGDEVLRAVAEELRKVTCAGDVLGRYGGEEFAILMPETSTSQARRACERLREAIAGRNIHYPDGSVGRVTVSTGVALLSAGEPSEQLISRADSALYAAKEDGRNLVRLAA